MTVSKPKRSVKTLAAKAGTKSKKIKKNSSPQVARVRVTRTAGVYSRGR